MAVFLGGHALASTSEPRTHCQIFCLMGDVSARLYKKHKDPDFVNAAVTFYENASKRDGSDPVPRWNLIELLCSDGQTELAKYHLNELIQATESCRGKYKSYVDRVIDDMKKILPQAEPWQDYISRLEKANSVIADQIDDESSHIIFTRRRLIAACLACALAGGSVISTTAFQSSVTEAAPKDSEVEQQEPFPRQGDDEKTNSTTRFDNDVLEVKVDMRDTDYSAVEYDLEDLAAVEYEVGDLA